MDGKKILIAYFSRKGQNYADGHIVNLEFGNRAGLLAVILLMFAVSSGFAQTGSSAVEQEIAILRRAYPEISFEYSFEPEAEDWKVTVRRDGIPSVLYRAEGRYLRKDQREDRERFWNLLYPFPGELTDPASLTEEQKQRIRRFGSTENRRNGRIAPTAFFDALHDCATRESTERHIVELEFLGRNIRVHEDIIGALRRVEYRILRAGTEDSGVSGFTQTLGSVSGYAWRPIRDSSGRSLHSMGLALDILPKDLQGKAVYWNWEKSGGNESWMLIPLADRWMPPELVIRIFEGEGFIWGGMWPIWDNMHFEYRPELILWRERF